MLRERGMANKQYPQNGRLLYNIAMREPYHLPDEVIKIPPPPQQPSPPASPNMLMFLLPPLVMILGNVITGIVTKVPNIPILIPTLMMGLGLPLANLINVNSQKKKYKKALVEREEHYKQTLAQIQSYIDELVRSQRNALERQFPSIRVTYSIGIAAGRDKRLWWRRPEDKDFLTIRLGYGKGNPTFKIETSNLLGNQDRLEEYSYKLREKYINIDDLPFLLDIKRVGSLAVCSMDENYRMELVRRLLADVVVHHSPEDVEIFVVSDHPKATEYWEWMRWLPHTRAVDPGNEVPHLLFDLDRINSFMDNLKNIFFQRLENIRNYSSNGSTLPRPTIIVVMDDLGAIRQTPDIARMASEGYQTGIFLIFLSEEKVPRTCRARVEVDQKNKLHYIESIESTGSGNVFHGHPETLKGKDALKLARKLSGLAVAGGERSVVLPSTVRISAILNEDPLNIDTILSNWRKNTHDSDQMLLPVGQYVDRSGLSTYEIDFRPETLGGKGAYHAMMIGTTGSGKSIFMQSMVLAAAHRYSPRQINFLFMDFKAGAAELKKVSDLPHSVGMITDLSPALAERALQALENELSRRKIIFDSAGKISDIWEYNRRFPNEAMPHLLVVIDEFAEGINILPNLVDRLRELGRQGRAFGMYFFLANQEVNSAVDSLKANVGWYVLLKVNRQEEMSLIGRNYPVPLGRGHGYIKVKNEVTTIRGAYAGLPANAGNQDENEVGEYSISIFTLNGLKKTLYRYDPKQKMGDDSVFVTELDALMALIKDAASKMGFLQANPIYLDPMPESIPLSYVFGATDFYSLFNGNGWVSGKGERNIIPTGFVDIPSRCQQQAFSINFNENGGSLWVVGSPGSGKSLTLITIATSIAFTHSPELAHIYVLEFGTGALSCLEALPHTGAVVKPNESERIERLFRFLGKEISSRTEIDWRSKGLPDIYLFINNVADFRQQYPDQSEELGRFIRFGGSVGIHVIVSSNRGSELPRTLGGNIPSRIVLQMAEKQDYTDVLSIIVSPLSLRTEGRGYYLSEGIVECQIAFPDKALSIHNLSLDNISNIQNSEKDLQEIKKVVLEIGGQMSLVCEDKRLPNKIESMKEELTVENFMAYLNHHNKIGDETKIPLAIEFENLEPVFIDPLNELPFWTVLGPRQSGKTTLLLDFIYHLYECRAVKTQVTCISLKKGPLSKINTNIPEIEIVDDTNAIIEKCNSFPSLLEEQPDIFRTLIIDDVGLPYLNNNQPLIKALDQLAEVLVQSSHNHFLFIIADMVGNLKGSFSYSSALIKLFQQHQTGVFFSLDDYDSQWFNVRISPQMRKSYNISSGNNLPTGRGFLVRKGKIEYIQIPFIRTEHINALGKRKL